MYGWRGRIGLILAKNNSVCEPEFNRVVPDGVSVHAARLTSHTGTGVPEYDAPDIMKINQEEVPLLAGTLAALRPSVVIFPHTAASMGDGPAFRETLIQRMSERAGCPALTTASAVLQAFEALGAKKIAIVDPSPRANVARQTRQLLEQELGTIQVVNEVTPAHENPYAVNLIAPTMGYRWGREADHPDADVIFLGGNTWRTIESIAPLEADLGKPVVTGNQACIWAALKILGVRGVQGYGALFDH